MYVIVCDNNLNNQDAAQLETDFIGSAGVYCEIANWAHSYDEPKCI